MLFISDLVVTAELPLKFWLVAVLLNAIMTWLGLAVLT